MGQSKFAADTLRFIRCGIGDETYALDMLWVRSIQRMDRLRPNPEAAAKDLAPVGWLSSGEGDIPVFSLAAHLQRPDLLVSSTKGNALQRIIVLNSPSSYDTGGAGQSRAWLVDRVSQVIQIPANRLVPLPVIAINPAANYFDGLIKLEEALLLRLSPERIAFEAKNQSAEPPISESETTQAESHDRKSETRVERSQNIQNLADTQVDAKSKTRAEPSRSIGRIIVFSTTQAQAGEQPLSFGLSVSQVPEILNPLPMTPVPGAPPFVLGLVNWRDYPVPVIDLNARLGLPANPFSNEQTRLIIARGVTRETFLGFPIRPDIQALRLPIAHQPSARSLSLDRSLTKGSVELENETLVIPDIQGILGL